MKFSSPLGVGLVPSKPLICISRIIFSSPLGDGVVRGRPTNPWTEPTFSSPLGVGLVLIAQKQKITLRFRPQVGLGCFTSHERFY